MLLLSSVPPEATPACLFPGTMRYLRSFPDGVEPLLAPGVDGTAPTVNPHDLVWQCDLTANLLDRHR
jgi:hypothetical protein